MSQRAGHDAIVIGAGSAGCVAARRLADQGRRVALVEAGPGGPAGPALRSIDAVRALGEDGRFWPATTAVTGSGRSVGYRQGFGLGGGSAVNTLVAMVGNRADYDRWEALGPCPGWNWSTMAPWLEAALATWPARPVRPGPLARAVGAAAAAAGHPTASSSALVDACGFAPAALMIAAGARRSLVDSHLADAPPELTVIQDTAVRRVLPAAGSPLGACRESGVELADGEILLAPLVVVAAGALRTPCLLAASGLLGGELARPVEDHPSFSFTLVLHPDLIAGRPAVATPPISAVLRWSTAGTGPPDALALVMEHVGTDPVGQGHGAVIVALTETESVGRLDAGGGEPLTFRPGWLQAAADRIRFRAAVRHVAELLASAEVTAVAERVAVDEAGTDAAVLAGLDDDQLDRWLIDHPGPVSHAAATCPMGDPAVGAVVDPAGALVGHPEIRVVDASVLPRLPGANLQVPVMAVAERLMALLR